MSIGSIFNTSEYLNADLGDISSQEGLKLINKSLEKYLQDIPAFRCMHCGYKMRDFLWRCPACHHWDTIDHQ